MSFSKRDTNITKGIAILSMLIHHIIGGYLGESILFINWPGTFQVIASTCKVCVALFLILSGYGLSVSYQKSKSGIKGQIKFVLSHYIQLMFIYWPVLIVTQAFRIFLFGWDSFAYFYNRTGVPIVSFIVDLFGFGAFFGDWSYLGGWFLSAIVGLYILFPLLYFLVKKFGIPVLVVLFLPWVFYLYKGDINMHTDSIVFYAFTFAFGIFLYKHNVLDRLKQIKKIYIIVFLTLLFPICFVLRLIVTLPFDTFLAFSIIIVEATWLWRFKTLSKFLNLFGVNSVNIWLMHYFIYRIALAIGFATEIQNLLFVVISSLGFSLVINEITKICKIDVLCKSLRKRIEK